MREHIKHQIIEDEGKPIFVLVPFSEYVKLIEQNDRDITIPHQVVEAHILKGKSLLAAWREYKNIKMPSNSFALRCQQYTITCTTHF